MTDEKIINVGIIGMGRMGITHFSILNSYPGINISCVADTSKMVLKLLKKYVGVSVYTDYNKMFKDSKPDAILVCTPPHLHYDILDKAYRNNIHAFVEKPYTVDANQSKELSEKFEEKGLVNQVGYVNRFNDVFLSVKEHLSSGIIGKPIRFRSEMFSRTIVEPDDGSGWRGKRETGGGAVFEMAAHAIDLVNFYFGKPDTITGTSMQSVYSKNVEDIVSSTFLFNSGLSGTIYVNWSDESFRKPTNKIEIFGSEGKILADQHSFKLFLKEENKERGYRKGWNTIYITDIFNQVPFYVRGNEFTRQLYHFADCILKKVSDNSCSFEVGSQTQSVINEMFINQEENNRKI